MHSVRYYTSKIGVEIPVFFPARVFSDVVGDWVGICSGIKCSCVLEGRGERSRKYVGYYLVFTWRMDISKPGRYLMILIEGC